MPLLSEFQAYRADAVGQSSGQVSEEPLNTQEANARVTVGAASGAIAAAGTGDGRLVRITVDPAGVTGIHIALGEAATTSKMRLYPGESITISTELAVNGIRGGASDVTVEVLVLKN